MSDELRQHLMAIREARGRLTPAAIVEAATPKAHPLHDRFEWDNRTAGHKYRLVQAAELVRTVRIETVIDDRPEQIRGIVSVPSPAGREYVPTEEIAEDPLTSAMVLRDFEREWKAFRRRWQHLSAFIGAIRGEIDKAS